MKKFLAIMIGALFVLSFAASAFAIHAEIPAESQAVVAKGTTQITLGGEVRTRGWWKATKAASTSDAAWYDQRVRLSVDANVAPGVTGFVQLESHSGTDGDKYKWGAGNAPGTPTGGAPSNGLAGTNSKPDTKIDILQAWILYTGKGLLGVPAGMKVGHMPLALGYGNFFNNTQYGDDAIVLFADPMKGMHVGLLTVKFNEGGIGNMHDDLDAYVALITYKLDDRNTLGANYTYVNSPGLMGAGTDLKLQNASIHADGGFGAFGYKAEIDYQFGSVGSGPGKGDFGGYAMTANLNYKFDPVNVRASIIYGSGDNDADNDIEEFLPFTGNTQNYSFIYEYQHATTANANGAFNLAAPSDGHAAGIANTFYFNLGADYKASKEIGLSLDAYIFRAAKAAFANQSKSAGWEVDAKMTYALAKNLNYQIDAGYYKTGNFFKDAGSTEKSVTALRHMLTLSF